MTSISSPFMGFNPAVEGRNLDAEASVLRDRITDLGKKIDELYRRPQMDYTDYTVSGYIMVFDVVVPNRTALDKPRWIARLTPETSDQETLYFEFPIYGVRTEGTIENILERTKQPYKTITTLGSTINSYTTTTDGTPILNTKNTYTSGVSGTGTTIQYFHWEEIGYGAFGWVQTDTAYDSTWNGNTPGDYRNTVTTGTTYITNQTITHTTTPTTTSP